MPLTDVTNALLPKLPPRAADSHKGDFGRALVVGGSRGMSGAVALAGLAALRGGAGLVTLAVPGSIQDVVASLEPSYMTRSLPDANGQLSVPAADEVLEMSTACTAIALGPGLGRSAALTELVGHLFHKIQKPMVVDADALFAIAEEPEALAFAEGPRILTPHPGEFARLTGETYDDTQRVEAAAEFARSGSNLIVLLKGHRTVVTDGQQFCINPTGNPGMATGGSGDVLTGIITALLCQGLSPFEAARLGAHVHGLAGDLAARELGQISLIASDLIVYLPKAFRSLANGKV